MTSKWKSKFVKNTKGESVYPQSAVIPFRGAGQTLEVLMMTNGSGKRWIFPKGLIEDHLSAADSAAQEAYEEAGIRGRVLPDVIGRYSYRKWGGVCEVEVYLMCVEEELEEWPEASWRKRRWVTIDKARRILDKRVPFRLLDEIARIVG